VGLIKLPNYRIRRVKCDEAKPSCVRCQKFGIDCDGYISLGAKATNSQATKLLLPKCTDKQPLPFESLVPSACRDDRQLVSHFMGSQQAKGLFNWRHTVLGMRLIVPSSFPKPTIYRAPPAQNFKMKPSTAISKYSKIEPQPSFPDTSTTMYGTGQSSKPATKSLLAML
jgi:hypothetical protein